MSEWIKVVGGAITVTAHSALSGLTTGDDHTQYQKESEKGAASGYASLDGAAQVPIDELANAIAFSIVLG